MQSQGWQLPDWWYPEGNHPANDDGYFGNMCRIIFQAGLNWNVIEKKWSTTKKAFAGFSVDKVADFTDADVKRLLKDEGIVRNRGKIEAIIKNAQIFKEIRTQNCSFEAYIGSLDKSNNYTAAVKELSRRFKWLGPSSASLFLLSVGEPIKHEGWM